MRTPSPLLRCLTALALALASAALAASCGGNPDDPAALSAACENYCAAQAKPMCKNGLDPSTCKAQCSQAAEALGNICIKEYTDAFNCASTLEFSCMNDFPVPAPTDCLEESQALQTCQKEAPCQGYCTAAIAAGCGGASQTDCETACKAEIEKQQFCGNDLERVRTCEGGETLQCVGDKPTTPLCLDEKRSYADCLVFDDPCSAYCFLADEAGCPGGTVADCIMSCQTERGSKANCQFNYDDWVQCVVDKGVTCNGANPTVPECTTQRNTWEMCM